MTSLFVLAGLVVGVPLFCADYDCGPAVGDGYCGPECSNLLGMTFRGDHFHALPVFGSILLGLVVGLLVLKVARTLRHRSN